MLNSVRLTAMRTWRLESSGGACTVSSDLAGYRAAVDTLKGQGAASDYSLPWPTYKSKLWAAIFGDNYRDTRTRNLVAALIPLRAVGSQTLGSDHAQPSVEVEVLWHPFAVTAATHVTLNSEAWPTTDKLGAALQSIRKSTLQPSGAQLRDGIPTGWVLDLGGAPGSRTEDADGRPSDLRPQHLVYVLSGLHHSEAAPAVVAHQLASAYDGTTPHGGQPMRTEGSAIAVTASSVGFVLPAADQDCASKIKCLHHNMTTLLAYMQNLAACATASPTLGCEWFHTQAGVMLTHLYARSAPTFTGDIYKARLSQLWIDQQNLKQAINSAAAGADPPPPTI